MSEVVAAEQSTFSLDQRCLKGIRGHRPSALQLLAQKVDDGSIKSWNAFLGDIHGSQLNSDSRLRKFKRILISEKPNPLDMAIMTYQTQNESARDTFYKIFATHIGEREHAE